MKTITCEKLGTSPGAGVIVDASEELSPDAGGISFSPGELAAPVAAAVGDGLRLVLGKEVVPGVKYDVEAFAAWQVAKRRMTAKDKSFACHPEVVLSFLFITLFSHL